MDQILNNLLSKIADPILAILILVMCGVVYFLYKSNKEKTTEIKELNKTLLDVIVSDKEVIIELKNTIAQSLEVDKEQTEASKAGTEILRRNNELLMQLITKVEYSISKKS